MDRLTTEQRLQIIEFYYQNSCSVRKVHRALLPFYGRHSRPSEQAIRKIVTKFRTKFTLLDIKPPTRLRNVRSKENIAAVSASVTEDREMSIRRRSQQLGLCYSTTLKILREDLGVKPFKMATYEEIKDVPNHPEVYLIDVRNPDELEKTGVIPASINIPMPELDAAFKMADNDFKKIFNRPKPSTDTTLIFSCQAGGRAQRAADLAITNGFVNAKAYKGSWTEWAQKEGL